MGWMERWDAKNQVQAEIDNAEAPEIDEAIRQIFGWRGVAMAVGFVVVAVLAGALGDVVSVGSGDGPGVLVRGLVVGVLVGFAAWVLGRRSS